MGLLSPLVAGADNAFVFIGSTLVQQLLWIVGLHGDNMWVTNFQPFGLMWLEENATALANGSTVFDLPHVLAAYGTGDLHRIRKDSFYWYQRAIASNGKEARLFL